MNHTSKILLLIVATTVVLCAIASKVMIGRVCSDGTIYAGLSGIGTPMYATRCDAGQRWNRTKCIGKRIGLEWNSGKMTGVVTVGTINGTDGKMKTATLIATDSHNEMVGVQPHIAAQYCANLSKNGHNDWYLPSKSELNTLYIHKTVIKNFNLKNSFYWSSTEAKDYLAWPQRFSDGYKIRYNKGNAFYVRCVRR